MISAILLLIAAQSAADLSKIPLPAQPAPPSPLESAQQISGAATDLYFRCVRDKSLTYARGRESAEAIAEAVVSACSVNEGLVHRTTIDVFKANRVAEYRAEEAWSSQMKPDLQARARREAIRWVIEARLPSPQKAR